MVLSPIEPVAPRTLTARTADATALLLRNGTALMFSPNHKSAADAIHAVSQKPENRSHDDGGDEPVETIQQPAVPRDEVAGVLDAKTPLHRGLKEIAELGSNRQSRPQQQKRAQFEGRIDFAERGEARGNHKARRKAADGASPGFLGTDPRPEFRSANAAACEIATDIGYPHHQQNQDQRDKSVTLIEAHQNRCDLGR